METFRGKAHLLGAKKEWDLELEIDCRKKDAEGVWRTCPLILEKIK